MSVNPDRTSIKKILIVAVAQLLVGRPSSTFVISTSITLDTLNSITEFEIFLKKIRPMSYLYTSERSQMYKRPLFLMRVAGTPPRGPTSPCFKQREERSSKISIASAHSIGSRSQVSDSSAASPVSLRRETTRVWKFELK